MEEETNAPAEEKTTEETTKVQVTYFLTILFEYSFLSFSANLLSSTIKAPRYPQVLQSHKDQS
jgi:hypothetical protein